MVNGRVDILVMGSRLEVEVQGGEDTVDVLFPKATWLWMALQRMQYWQNLAAI